VSLDSQENIAKSKFWVSLGHIKNSRGEKTEKSLLSLISRPEKEVRLIF
jgi:hypothetical protein